MYNICCYITVVHGDAAVFDAADKDAQLVLAFRVLHQFGLDAKAPHLFQVVARQLHLVERLAANFHQLVTRHLIKNVQHTTTARHIEFYICITIKQYIQVTFKFV